DRAEERVDDLEAERDHAEARADDLRRQLREANARNDDVEELVTYVEEERSLQERREAARGAPVWRRAKWWFLGRPTETDEE
ncbi:hypothetical protein ACFQE1_11520, partial [Halobium palmae]